jgi:hypothetical protein
MSGRTPPTGLLDADVEALDEAGLRRFARAHSEATGAAYVSRSYRFPFAMIAWHDQPVGVDIERVQPLDAVFLESICTPSERHRTPPAGERGRYATALWSSKEALAKALGDALDYDPRRLESPLFWPGGAAGPWRARELAAPAGYVAWLCWRACP